MSTTAVFAVEGMSCGHCERSVSAQLAAVPGVTDVLADAPTGRVTVSFEFGQALDEQRIRDAVDEAGFTLTGRI
ncbi:copper chaperone CopZ [Kitasatospora gansuensis]|uniref:Copper chaperone CopZ n=1 Tax=Kitasatospora gansuensis TaxID=258050 RepID=A0A7W7SKR9_9ACTN|nr:heavy-metal-associated domain-containing protein [Kitasatospora gansuensis]MBB4951683.1 copper chaperone CopZ [Kitasatospora gansuensis]